MKRAKGQPTRINNNAYKPNFMVYNLIGSSKCVVLMATKFKPAQQNSYVKSDRVKFAKQMKDTLIKLIVKDVHHPKVCGIYCEGPNVQTYMMDLAYDKLYRLINISKIKLFKHLHQISLLPSILVGHLLSSKSIAVETANKAEAATLHTLNNLKRPASDPAT